MALTQANTTLPLITVPAVFESSPNALLFFSMSLVLPATVLRLPNAYLDTTLSLPTPHYLAGLLASYR